MVLDALVDEFQEKNENSQTHSDSKDDEGTRHVDQSQRFDAG